MESNSPHLPTLPIYYAAPPSPLHCPVPPPAASHLHARPCRRVHLQKEIQNYGVACVVVVVEFCCCCLSCLPCLVLSLSAASASASLLLVSACPLKCVNLQVCVPVCVCVGVSVCVRAGGSVCSLLSSSSASSTFSCRNRAHSGAQWQHC